MRRREFIAGLAAAWPLAARAQQPALPVIGLLMSTSREANLERLAAFREGLSKSGYVEMRNVAIEYRSADGQYERLPALAAELVRRVNVIVAGRGFLRRWRQSRPPRRSPSSSRVERIQSRRD